MLLGAGALYPLVPALRSLAPARTAGAPAPLLGGELVGGTGGCQSFARCDTWISISLSVALVVVLAAIQFLIANDLAVSRTFFLLPLMSETRCRLS